MNSNSNKYRNPNCCPRFIKCNAPICPLDESWLSRSNLKEDSTCFYLLESVKDGAQSIFLTAQLEELYEVIVSRREAILFAYKRISSKLDAAKKSGSRMARKIGGCHE